MKYFTLIILIFTIALFSSCDQDDDANVVYDYTGTWKLISTDIITTLPNNISVQTKITPDENCLADELIIIKADGTVTFESNSTIEATLQLIEEDEYEHIINCINTEASNNYTWITGDYSINNPDGSVTTSSSGGFNMITFFDENNEVYNSGFMPPGSESLTFLKKVSPVNHTIEINGETIEVDEFRGSFYEKQ